MTNHPIKFLAVNGAPEKCPKGCELSIYPDEPVQIELPTNPPKPGSGHYEFKVHTWEHTVTFDVANPAAVWFLENLKAITPEKQAEWEINTQNIQVGG